MIKNGFMRKVGGLCVLIIMVLFFSSCARKMMFTKSVVVPSASGWVKVKKDHNGNYSINLSVRDLPAPGKLVPPREYYITWNQTAKNGIMNIGQLNTSRSMWAKGYKASMNTTSTFKPRRIFISAEDNKTVNSPGTQIVLTTEDF
jgi:hypothetical protein